MLVKKSGNIYLKISLFLFLSNPSILDVDECLILKVYRLFIFLSGHVRYQNLVLLSSLMSGFLFYSLFYHLTNGLNLAKKYINY